MKRFAFLIGLVAVLLVSCTPLATNNENVSLSVSGDQIFRNAFGTGGGARAADDGSVYSLTVSLEGSGSVRTQTASGTEAEVRGSVFSFDEIAVGATVTVSCEIRKNGTICWVGESDPITIQEGSNNINVVMKKYVSSISFRYDSVFVVNSPETSPTNLLAILDVEPASEKDNVTWIYDESMLTMSPTANGAFYSSISTPSSGTIYGTTEIKARAGNKTATCKVYIVSSNTMGTFTYDAYDELTNSSTTTAFAIPYGVRGIGSNAFAAEDGADNEVLKSVVIPESVNNINSGAFNGCPNLQSVEFKDTVGWCNQNVDSINVASPQTNANNFKMPDSDWQVDIYRRLP